LKLGKVILRLEKARRELLNTDPRDKGKLLAASRKMDRLVMEYYRVKHGLRATKFATGK